MVDIQNRRALKNWLRLQPRQTVDQFSARIALRAIPEYSIYLEKLISQQLSNILADFHATSILVAIGNNEDIKKNFPFSDLSNRAHLYTIRTVTHASNPNMNFNVAVSAVANACESQTLRHGDIQFTAIEYDIKARRTPGQNLLHLPLWPQPTEEKSAKEYSSALSHWHNVKSKLLKTDANWSVWTDWYDELLVGHTPFIEEIEIGDPKNGLYGRCTFPNKMYEMPVELNAALKQVIDDYWGKQTEVLSQDPIAEVFNTNDESQIDVATLSIGQGLQITPVQEDWYEALRDSVSTALEAGQQLGQTKPPLEKFLEALPQDMLEAKVAKLWPRANKIRRLLDKHEKAAKSEDFSLDKLETETAIDLQGVVGAYNNLRINDPNLIAADENAKSPQEVEELQAQNIALEPIIEDAISSDLVTAEAAEVLTESAEVLSELGLQNEIMGRMAADNAAKTQRNWLRKVVSVARDLGAIGGAITGGSKILEFLAKHKDTISQILTSAKDIIRAIVGP